MSRFTDIFKRNQINPRVEGLEYGLMSWYIQSRRYADAYLWMVLKKIFGGIRNVRFTCSEDNDRVKYIINWFDSNATTLLWCMWTYGYIVVGIDERNRLYIPKYSEVKKDQNGNVIGYDIVIYSDTYRFDRKSDFSILKEHIGELDTLKNAESFLTSTYGVLSIISGAGMPINEGEKEDILKKLRDNSGITRDKFQFAIFNKPVNVQSVNLPIKDLALDERIKNELMLIAGYFGVPYDLIPFSGKSTYANQEQAVKSFYSDCISPLAEILLSVIRYIIKKSPSLLVPSESVSFTIDNVPELEDDSTERVEYLGKVADLIGKCRELNIPTEELEKQFIDIE